jgi:hypothetical protein
MKEEASRTISMLDTISTQLIAVSLIDQRSLIWGWHSMNA